MLQRIARWPERVLSPVTASRGDGVSELDPELSNPTTGEPLRRMGPVSMSGFPAATGDFYVGRQPIGTYSALIPAARITLPHLSVYSTMNLLKSEGELANTV